jgi:hypothetical protein
MQRLAFLTRIMNNSGCIKGEKFVVHLNEICFLKRNSILNVTAVGHVTDGYVLNLLLFSTYCHVTDYRLVIGFIELLSNS